MAKGGASKAASQRGAVLTRFPRTIKPTSDVVEICNGNWQTLSCSTRIISIITGRLLDRCFATCTCSSMSLRRLCWRPLTTSPSACG